MRKLNNLNTKFDFMPRIQRKREENKKRTKKKFFFFFRFFLNFFLFFSSTHRIKITFVDPDKKEHVVDGEIGMDLMRIAHANDIELEGACEGSLACSTCHVIVADQKFYDALPEPKDEENDMLDLAFGLTETSRLGCQVIAKEELDGIKVILPSATRNLAVDGYKPKPH